MNRPERVCVALLVALGVPAGARAELPEAPRFSASATTKDRESSVELHLAAQMRWQTDWPGPDHEADSEALLRRIRPTLKGRLLSDATTWLLHLSTAPGSLELMDLWVDQGFHPQARVRLGAQKVPFSRYRLNSFKDLIVADWSYPTLYFGAERQLGVVLHNGADRPPELEYELGVFTGRNSRASNAVGLARLFGEKPLSPSALAASPASETMHPEVVLHLARSTPGMNVRRDSDLEGGPLRTSFGVSAAWDTDPDPRQDLRLRLAPEAQLKVCGLGLGATGYLGLFDGEQDAAHYTPGLWGFALRASLVLAERYEVAARWAEVRTLSGLRDELAALPAGAADAMHAERDLTVGLNAYLLGTSLKATLDGSFLQHDRSSGTVRDARVRAQLQLAF